MSTTADVCPYCLRFEGMTAARADGTRYCPLCGTDWQTLDAPTELPAWREDSVVLPLPGGLPPAGDAAFRETGPVPALGTPASRRAASAALQLTPPPGLLPSWELDADAPGGDPLFPDEGGDPHPLGDLDPREVSESSPPLGASGLTPESTQPVLPPPPPQSSPWTLVLGAAAALTLAALGLVTLSDAGLTPVPAPAPPPSAAVPVTTPPAPATTAAAPSLPPLPTPRASPERKSAAVKEHIERALEGQPDTVQAEIGVRVEDGVAFLIGTVDGPATRELVTRAARETFGIRAVDDGQVRVERRPPPVHVVAQGETLSAMARRLYGSGAQWRRIYEMNPGIDPNLIRVGQPLSLPPPTPGAP